MSESFQCQVITPDAAVLDVAAQFAAFTAHDGEIGILHNRAPLLCKLGIGHCRIECQDRTYQFFIDGGLAQMLENHLTILTERAISADAINIQAVQDQLQKIQTRPAKTVAEVQQRQDDTKKLTTQLRLAQDVGNKAN